ncbi:MAG: transcriptional repressor [Verrucomicrobia bacterium]|nr:transcriptional repressor [Verrucomicrobiota bacterium]
MALTDKNQLRQTIRNAGLRATPARIETLELLHGVKYPVTHADVAHHLSGLGFDQATAYRNLNDLVVVGIVRRTELGDHVWRFELVGNEDPPHHPHPHFLCVDCGDVSCLSEIPLPKASLDSIDQIHEVTEILLRGYCRKCKLNGI